MHLSALRSSVLNSMHSLAYSQELCGRPSSLSLRQLRGSTGFFGA